MITTAFRTGAKPEVVFQTYDDEDNEVEVRIAGHVAICDNCQGGGRVVDPRFESPAGYSAEDVAEWDDGFRDSYFGGKLDVACPECEGCGRVVEPNDTPENATAIAQLRQLERDLAYDAAESAAERRMGA